MSNKVNFGLKNCHYAPISFDETGNLTFATPIAIPGAVELSFEPRGDMVEFYADDMLYYAASNNQGYDGTLSIANLPDQFLVDALGEEKDEDDNVLNEIANAKGSAFAFMFEFDGDVKATRHVMYNCTANRPTISGATKTDSVEPSPNELTFVASPIQIGEKLIVKTKTLTTTSAEIYNTWYESVYEKAPAA